MENIIIEPFDKGLHNRNDFDCGVEELNIFIKKIANQQQKRGLNKVYVATEKESPAPKKIFGYYTLSSNVLSFENLPDNFSKKMPKNYPIPTVKIGRLAKDKNSPPNFGKILLGAAINQIIRLSKEIGIVGIDVDAKSEKARNFYKKYGFIPLIDNEDSLFLPIKNIK